MSYIGNTNTTQGFTPAVDYFSGDGSTVAFTLSRPVASVAQVQANISNVPQNPSSAFSVSGNTITFTSAPPSGTNNIYVYYTSPITQVIAPSQGTVTSESFGQIVNFTTTGNTVLGDASTDTLNVGNGGLVKDASGNVGIGTSSPTGGANRVVDVYGSGSSAINFHNATSGTTATDGGVVGQYGSDLVLFNYEAGIIQFGTSNAERARIDSNGQMRTTNGAGVVALAYDCRAWVNLNGTGTVAIRASGNVSSITDLGIGTYRVNFSTAMPDANYAVNLNGGDFPTSANTLVQSTSNTTAKCELYTYASGTQVDLPQVFAAVFR